MNALIGILMGVMALFGLFLASRAQDAAMYGFGLLLFAFAVLFVFYLIHRHAEDRKSS